MASGQCKKIELSCEVLYNENLKEYQDQDANKNYHHYYISKTQWAIAKAGKTLIDAHKSRDASGSS